MILSIDTSNADLICISLNIGKKEYIKRVNTKQSQSEKLLLTIEALLKKHKVNFNGLQKIKVQSVGNSFTSLRIGVLTANALAYALEIPIEAMNGEPGFSFSTGYAIAPSYESEPNINCLKGSTC